MISPRGGARRKRAPGQGRRDFLLLLLALAANLVAVTVQVRRQGSVPVLEAAAHAGAVGQDLIRSTGQGARSLLGGFHDVRALARENDDLRHRLARLEWEVTLQRGLAHRARGFTEFDAAAFALGEPVPAEVTGYSTSPVEGRLAVNRGARHGVTVGGAVMSSSGLVGRIVSVARLASTLEPLTHAAAAVAVVTSERRVHGLARNGGEGGAGTEVLRMDYVPAGRDVVVGEEVITSSLDGFYPKGLVVGTVSAVRETGGMLLDIHIDVAVDFSALERVFILPFRPTDAPAPDAPPAEEAWRPQPPSPS